MPISIDEIRITATISEQEIKKPDSRPLEPVDVEAIISATVEAVLDRLKELKED